MGGEFVRAAAKMAGAGAVNASVLGSPTVPQLGQFLRGSSRPSVFVGSSSPVPPAKGVVASAEVEVVMKATVEIDEWELANLEEDLADIRPKPRIVFGSAPSFEEAKEATMELNEALDKYVKQMPESCLSIRTSPPNSVPRRAINAFKLLKESPQAQSVVASIVSDSSVWNAMLNNEVLKSFLQSYHNNKLLEYHESSEELEEAPDANQADKSKIESRNVLPRTVEYIRTSIDDMLAMASSFLRKVFGSSPAEVSGNDKAMSGYSTAEIAMGSSIMGLVVVVVAVLVAKRN